MNEHIENYKINLNHVVELITRSPFFEEEQTGKYKIPPFTEKSILGLASYFGHFNEHIIKEADKPENGNALKKSVANSFFPIVKNYVKWYNQNLNEIEDKFGKDNMYSAIHRIIEMTENTIVEYLGVKVQTKEELKSYNFKILFNTNEDYSRIVKTLISKGFMFKINEQKYSWVGLEEEPSLMPLKLLCTLAIVLKQKRYFKPNLKKNQISSALTYTFGINVSDAYFGQVSKDIAEIRIDSNDKNAEYYNTFHFINTL